ncbi:hypothetical protein DBT_0040 [Dissulfuribacter thermophilus]|uniref:Uncharacterized protein n=1 Tax=Dissulfuribacter thermophilus TaxID=1156395 RepID=A0A1B9F8L7_9BACT|nr:hypothetical protein DBT_0040 [Dissulfuribacter thermophilus]
MAYFTSIEGLDIFYPASGTACPSFKEELFYSNCLSISPINS